MYFAAQKHLFNIKYLIKVGMLVIPVKSVVNDCYCCQQKSWFYLNSVMMDKGYQV